MKSKYGVIARLVWDGGKEVRIPEEAGTPREDQMQGSAGERLSELSGRICYDSLGKGRSSPEYHKHIQEVGHFSVYAHPQITVFVAGEKMEFGRALTARTLVNRPGLFVRFTKEGVVLTYNPRVLIEWDVWSDPEDPDEKWLKDILRYHAEQEWPMITPCNGFRATDRLLEISLVSHRINPSHNEEKWLSLFVAGSRGFSHEQVRHNWRCGISQRSTRFVAEDESPWVDHPLVQEYLKAGIPETTPALLRMVGAISTVKENARKAYSIVASDLQEWLISRGVEKITARKQARGAARGYLGNALYTELIFSASVAQWKRMLRLRCSAPADAEIRAVYAEVLRELQGSRYADDFREFSLTESTDGLGLVLVEKK